MALGIGIGIPFGKRAIPSPNTGKPVNLVAPVISGSTELGSTLSCTTGTWIGVPDFFYFTYQWNRNGVPILDATNNTYVTVLSDSLADITCTVTASNCFRLAFDSPYNSGYYSTYFN
jgi:hypothetical protein